MSESEQKAEKAKTYLMRQMMLPDDVTDKDILGRERRCKMEDLANFLRRQVQLDDPAAGPVDTDKLPLLTLLQLATNTNQSMLEEV